MDKKRNTKFRENCEILANDIVEDTMACGRIDNLKAAMQLYITANMPNPKDLN